MTVPWKKALGNIRLLGPDIPAFRADVKLVWDHIEALERDPLLPREMAENFDGTEAQAKPYKRLRERAGGTVYICLLCNSEAASFSDELEIERTEEGWSVETPLGRAMRVEAVLEDHMARVHGLAPEEALEALRALAGTGQVGC